MIISVADIKQLIEFKSGWTDERIRRKLAAIEETIRAYTNNNFQNRCIRGEMTVEDGVLIGSVDGLSVGDTIQITESCFNETLCVVTSIADDSITVDAVLFDEAHILVTKVEYPESVVDCCINLMEWELNHRAKVGIQSETLSRHSVTYFNQDSANQIMGYPASLLGCLRAYRKCRC